MSTRPPFEAILAVLVMRAGGEVRVPLSEVNTLETERPTGMLRFTRVDDDPDDPAVIVKIDEPSEDERAEAVLESLIENVFQGRVIILG